MSWGDGIHRHDDWENWVGAGYTNWTNHTNTAHSDWSDHADSAHGDTAHVDNPYQNEPNDFGT
ncbi:hypothetical protein D4R30_00045 [archaeon]|nr:MAG: hypothetical protein D4R30_00045 [archaeon]